MAIDKVDVVVIGMDPGGEDAVARLAKAGLASLGWKPGWSAANARTRPACPRK
jgi:hypothetical protein